MCPGFSPCFQGHSVDFLLERQAPSVVQAFCQQRAAELRAAAAAAQYVGLPGLPTTVKTDRGRWPSPEAMAQAGLCSFREPGKLRPGKRSRDAQDTFNSDLPLGPGSHC